MLLIITRMDLENPVRVRTRRGHPFRARRRRGVVAATFWATVLMALVFAAGALLP